MVAESKKALKTGKPPPGLVGRATLTGKEAVLSALGKDATAAAPKESTRAGGKGGKEHERTRPFPQMVRNPETMALKLDIRGNRPSVGVAQIKQAQALRKMSEEQGKTVDKIRPTGPAPQTVPRPNSSTAHPRGKESKDSFVAAAPAVPSAPRSSNHPTKNVSSGRSGVSADAAKRAKIDRNGDGKRLGPAAEKPPAPVSSSSTVRDRDDKARQGNEDLLRATAGTCAAKVLRQVGQKPDEEKARRAEDRERKRKREEAGAVVGRVSGGEIAGKDSRVPWQERKASKDNLKKRRVSPFPVSLSRPSSSTFHRNVDAMCNSCTRLCEPRIEICLRILIHPVVRAVLMRLYARAHAEA